MNRNLVTVAAIAGMLGAAFMLMVLVDRWQDKLERGDADRRHRAAEHLRHDLERE